METLIGILNAEPHFSGILNNNISGGGGGIPSGVITSVTVTKIWTGTQFEYDALIPNKTTLYFITG